MKKLVTLLLSIVMLLSLAACGGNEPSKDDDDDHKKGTSSQTGDKNDPTNGSTPADDKVPDKNEIPEGMQKIELQGLYLYVDEEYGIFEEYDNELELWYGDQEREIYLTCGHSTQYATSKERAEAYKDIGTGLNMKVEVAERNGISYVTHSDDDGYFTVTGYYVSGDRWWEVDVWYVDATAHQEEMIDIATSAHMPKPEEDREKPDNTRPETSGALYEELMNHPESPESDFQVNDNGDGTGLLYRYNGSDEIVVIPESVNGLRITSIGDFAFYNNETLKAVRLADSIETAGMLVFDNNTNLQVAVFGSGMRETGSNTFYECEALQQVVLNDGLEVIENSCFYGCTSLETIHIPNSVKEIVFLAFSGCTSLKEIILPEGIEYVSGSLFENCSSLASVYIPDSVTSISHLAFTGCSSLETVFIPGNVTSIGEGAFDGCTSLKEICIPEGVQGIPEYTFRACESLQSVEISSTVFRIDDGAFQNCKSLTSIEIPVSVVYMAEDAFDSCGEGITIIGEAGSDAEYYAKKNNINFQVKE